MADFRSILKALDEQSGESNGKAVPTLDEQVARDRESDRAMREKMAKWAAWIVSGQLAAMNILLFLLASGCAKLENDTFKWYMGETFGSLLGVCYIVFKYLFPERKQP